MRRRLLLAAALVVVAACGGGEEFTDRPRTAVAGLTTEACGKPIVGAAVVIRDELMATAAHNVAGAEEITFTFDDGEVYTGTVVGFDADRDVAFVATPGMHRLPIRMADPEEGSSGQVLRIFDGVFNAVDYSNTEILTAVGHDIFDDRSDELRLVMRFDADAGSGYSGAPVIDSNGTLAGIVSLRSRTTSKIYAVSTAEIREAFADVDFDQIPDNDRCMS